MKVLIFFKLWIQLQKNNLLLSIILQSKKKVLLLQREAKVFHFLLLKNKFLKMHLNIYRGVFLQVIVTTNLLGLYHKFNKFYDKLIRSKKSMREKQKKDFQLQLFRTKVKWKICIKKFVDCQLKMKNWKIKSEILIKDWVKLKKKVLNKEKMIL